MTHFNGRRYNYKEGEQNIYHTKKNTSGVNITKRKETQCKQMAIQSLCLSETEESNN